MLIPKLPPLSSCHQSLVGLYVFFGLSECYSTSQPLIISQQLVRCKPTVNFQPSSVPCRWLCRQIKVVVYDKPLSSVRAAEKATFEEPASPLLHRVQRHTLWRLKRHRGVDINPIVKQWLPRILSWNAAKKNAIGPPSIRKTSRSNGEL